MTGALVAARVGLAVVLPVAGGAKLADPEGSRRALSEFGVPARLVRVGAVGLPAVELGIAAGLLFAATARWAALAALLLFLTFATAIGVNIARGRHPDCHCFGQLHSSPAGPAALIRAGLLAAIAAAVVGFGWANEGPGVVSAVGDLSAAALAAIAGGLVVAAAGLMFFELLRRYGRLLIRVESLEDALGSAGIALPAPAAESLPVEHGLGIGEPAPDFELPSVAGEPIALSELAADGRSALLVFTDPSCGPCTTLLPELAAWQEREDSLEVALISRGDRDRNRSLADEHGLRNVLLQEDREVAAAYEVGGTPSAVLVDADLRIASGAAPGAEAIQRLVAANTAAPALEVVHRGPASIQLADLDGDPVDLQDFRGARTLVLFWNPACGFCRQMLDDLRDWESTRPHGAPELLVVSRGGVDDNRALGLESTIALDHGAGVMQSFGAPGTPSAVLVDEDGAVASPVAVGAQDVLALARDDDRRPTGVASDRRPTGVAS